MSRYLITFDIDTYCLKDNYPSKSWQNAYTDIKAILAKHGFVNIQGSVYLGADGVSESHGTIAVQELTAKLDWFYGCVSNIKFYRIESDLDAQFIADGVYHAKQAFFARLEQLKITMQQAGISSAQIDAVLKEQRFELPALTQSAK